ncbi:hypothetical protein Bhyg_07211, partial [Pseudolycoriella hygida]
MIEAYKTLCGQFSKAYPMDVNASSKDEIVLDALDSEYENDEEKRFNEIICYDSGVSGESSQEIETSDSNSQSKHQRVIHFTVVPHDLDESQKSLKAKSNAEPMRKYRAKQRSDPIKYQKYLERERIRNYRRKNEKKIVAAQETAQALGLPFVVLDTPAVQRGRRCKFGYDGTVSLVIPAQFDKDIGSDSDSFSFSDGSRIPVQVELDEKRDKICTLQKTPAMNGKKSSSQNLLPSELDFRERDRVKNSIKLDHDYVKRQTESPIKLTNDQKRTLNRLHNGISKQRSNQKSRNINFKDDMKKIRDGFSRITSGKTLKRRPTEKSVAKKSVHLPDNNSAEHEDLDDLFDELAKVAKKELPKDPLCNEEWKSDDGGDSLSVSMPVKLKASRLHSVELDKRKNPRDSGSSRETDQPKGIIWINDSPEQSP